MTGDHIGPTPTPKDIQVRNSLANPKYKKTNQTVIFWYRQGSETKKRRDNLR